MRLTEQEKVLCASFALKKDARHWWMTVQMRRDVTTMSWQDFVSEFRTMYFNREILAAQQDEFTSLRQGTMTVMEAINKFEQLARLCPELVPSETEKVRLMMKMFRSDIAKQVSAGERPPTRVSDCISRAIRAEYWNNRDKEERAQFFKARKEEKAMGKQTQPRQNFEVNQKGQPRNFAQGSKQFGRNKRKENSSGQSQQRNYPQKKVARGNEGNNNSYPVCTKCGRKHPGICRMGSNACYLCGKEGHFAKNCTLSTQGQNPSYPSRNPNSQLHAVQAKLEGPSIAQGRLEAPEPQARIYAYTKGDAEAGTSHVVTGQISIATFDAIVLFDSGATHSFISVEFALKIGRESIKTHQGKDSSLLKAQLFGSKNKEFKCNT
ncbi:hypothetical protein TIFTF001_043511 [Ficus carica]|uniref:CCHC-type domain-containing protein n=2 Tax=Ficus carica TaxID=3494 RepID=A0AA87YZ48_FICCA|nr:hypothetical protein TIFTF001_043508 [Ficus carica]GMN22429.1 hypothetical protein TIFTF001_043511 [Ficus carica]